MRFLVRKLTAKRRAWLLAAVGAVVLSILSGAFLLSRHPRGLTPEPAQVSASATNIGIAYVTLTPRMSAYYQLDFTAGALVTDVATDSPAYQAGIRPGDIILTFNGTRVEEDVPLLGMMRTCMAGRQISMEVWDGKTTRVVELFHVR